MEYVGDVTMGKNLQVHSENVKEEVDGYIKLDIQLKDVSCLWGDLPIVFANQIHQPYEVVEKIYEVFK